MRHREGEKRGTSEKESERNNKQRLCSGRRGKRKKEKITKEIREAEGEEKDRLLPSHNQERERERVGVVAQINVLISAVATAARQITTST